MNTILNGQINLSYQQPHEDISTLADVPLPPFMRMNSDGSKAVMIYRNQYKSIQELSEQEMRLAGLRINPVTNISSRSRYYVDIQAFDIKTGVETKITGLPENPRLGNLKWSPLEDKLAVTNTTEKGVELWIIDLQDNKAKKVTEGNINANMGRPFTWLKDNNSLLVMLLPSDRKSIIDTDNIVPDGPTVSVNESGTKAQNRTYQDLLKDPVDEANFETLSKSDIYLVSLGKEAVLWKKNGPHRSISISPDGEYILVAELKRPFSYIVPYYRFPTTYTIYDKSGNLIKVLLESPLLEEMPKGFMAVREGMRNIQWRDDKPATIVYVEALDGGDPEREVEYRDAVYMLQAPFNGTPDLLTKSKLRYNAVEWGTDDIAVLYDYWWNDRTLRTSFINPSEPDKSPVLFNERNYQDKYSDPGNFETKRNKYGKNVLDIVNGDQLYLLGDGYSQDGKLPFIDRYDISDSKTERLYQASNGDRLEDISRIMDINKGQILVWLESANEYPNYFFKNINSGKLTQVTFNKNPFSAIQDVHKEVIKYEREDGLELSATLYLPVGYDKAKKEKAPMILWAYPQEFKDKNSASQTTSNSKEFTFPYYGSPIYWVNRGYVVLDDAAFPIIGENKEEPNDDFIPQLVANAKAAIDAVDKLGYIDRNKVAVGGHSYGAFMTANLLTHSDLFAAGIARSGAYNRTLTPFGFQAEERNYWEAPNIYYEMSPFMHCDKMKTPLLLIHGQEDNNSGTYPMQSERYFNALKGLGAPVRLVMLPKESHGYSAKESIMHMLWEQDQWLETHVKNRK